MIFYEFWKFNLSLNYFWNWKMNLNPFSRNEPNSTWWPSSHGEAGLANTVAAAWPTRRSRPGQHGGRGLA
jgi:hypothetical protein